MSETYLVTGGAGFIGSHLIDELLARGHRVRVIDNFSTGRRENIAHVADDIEIVEGDIQSYERVRHAVCGVDRVIHLAALPSVPRSVQDPLTTHQVNTTGTLNVLLAARDERVRRVVFASSSSVYGANPALPKREDMMLQPISPYGVSKMAAERYCVAFSEVYGIETVALRYFNVFGARQNPDSQYSAVIPRFLKLAASGRRAVVYGDGTQTRDFTHVHDIVQGTLLAAEKPGVSGRAVNLAYGVSHSLADLIGTIGRVVGRELAYDCEAVRPGDVQDSYADVGLARELLGYEPHVGLEDGIALTVQASGHGAAL